MNLHAIAATMREAISGDPELLESLAIITGTLEAIDAEERAEAEWEDAQAMETGDMRCPPRE